MKVLMVCLGNICRSPLAEGILQSKVDPKHIQVDSAGTGGFHVGSPPDPRSIRIAQENGIDINHQRCRKFTAQDFDAYDVIYVMDKSNYNNIISLARTKKDTEKVRLLLSETDLEATEVPDPYYDTEEGFEKVYRMIDQACNVIAARLEK